MKIKYAILLLLIALSYFSKAQTYVTIPDANFVTYLQTNFPTCMSGNQMDVSCAGIQNATFVDVTNRSISDLTGIEYFINLRTLQCGSNQLASLPILPNSIDVLHCNNNQLISLPNIPNSLITLNCPYNNLTSLPILSNVIDFINCDHNQLTNLPPLPASLRKLICQHNQLTSLPALPNSLTQLACASNQLTSLPTLPDSLRDLNYNHNNITNPPILPNLLKWFSCSSNNVTSLPNLPASLRFLSCQYNKITNLPALSDSINTIYCSYNDIFCFPPFPASLTNLFISNNPFKCLPNYVAAMDSTTLAYPLCMEGDIANNPNGCDGAKGISGTVYNDNNNNCLMDAGDQRMRNVHLKLYDENNNFLAQKYSSNGTYNFNFSDSAGTYTVKLDTVGAPYTIQCASPGIDSTIILTVADPLANNVNFNVHCNQVMDLGVLATIPRGRIFPGLNHRLYIVAGDMNKWFNLGCPVVVEGKVQVTITGPATFNSVAAGALTPSVSGNVFTYNISDFSNINMLTDFRLWLTTDTTAQAGDNICVSVIVSGNSKSFNQNNNNYQFCYKVGNSFDPNMKEVYPVDVAPGYEDWLTYSIHFQNSGNAPAMNIRLEDTLDTNLNLETFQVINYSHYNRVSLHDKRLIVYYPNIQLPDSTSDPEGSQGFVQYRIKPKANLPLGTKIKNTANIYFDYNPPIVTNTTVNEFKAGIISVIENEANTVFTVYPNPGTGKYFIKLLEGTTISSGTIEVYNLLGEMVLNDKVQSNITPIDLSQQPNGVYFINIINENGVFVQKLIINK